MRKRIIFFIVFYCFNTLLYAEYNNIEKDIVNTLKKINEAKSQELITKLEKFWDIKNISDSIRTELKKSLIWHSILDNDKTDILSLEQLEQIKYQEISMELSEIDSLNFVYIVSTYFHSLVSNADKLKTEDKQKSLSLYKCAVDIIKSLLGTNHVAYAIQLNTVGLAYFSLNEFEKSIETHLKALSIFRKYLATNELDYAVCCGNIGMSYYSKGNNKEAEENYLLALKSLKNTVGETNQTYAIYLNNLALVYSIKGDFILSEKCFLQIKYIYETLEINDENYNHVLLNLADTYSKMGDYASAKKICNEVIKYHERKNLINTPEYGMSLIVLSSAYMHMGDYALSETYCLEALELYKKLDGINDYHYASVLGQMGLVFLKTGQYSSSKSNYIAALNRIKNIYGDQHSYYALLLGGLAEVYRETSDYSQAININRNALKIIESSVGIDNRDYAVICSNLSLCYQKISDTPNAEIYCLQALRIYKKIYGDNHYEYAMLLNVYATLQMDFGNYNGAENCFLMSLEIMKATVGELNSNYYVILNQLGLNYFFKNDYESAEICYMNVLNGLKTSLGEKHHFYAGGINNLALLYYCQRRYQEAEELYLKSLEIAKDAVGEDHPDYIMPFSNLTLMKYQKGYYLQAVEDNLKILEIRKKIFGEDHPDYGMTLGILIGNYLALGKNKMAESYFYQLVNNVEMQISKAWSFMSEKQRTQFWNKIQRPILESPLIAYSYHNFDGKFIECVFNAMLLSKGLLLNSTLHLNNLILGSQDSAVINKWKELKTLKATITKQLEFSKEKRIINVDEIKKEIEVKEKELVKISSAYRKFSDNLKIKWNDVQKKLKSNEVAIEFVNFNVGKDSIIYAALLLRSHFDSPKLIPMYEKHELDTLVIKDGVSYKKAFISNEGYYKNLIYNSKEVGATIWSSLIPYFEGVETIYFAPSGELHQLAIEYLPIIDSIGNAHKFTFRRLSSTREIVTNVKKEEMTSAVLYGGLHYDVDQQTMIIQHQRYQSKSSEIQENRSLQSEAFLDSLSRNGVTVSYLPETKVETDEIVTHLKDRNLLISLRQGVEGNEESFKALSGEGVNLLHIATHGFYLTEDEVKKQGDNSYFMLLSKQEQGFIEDKSMTQSGLMFAGANTTLLNKELPKDIEDGILTAKEISSLDFRELNIVVLSACQTGLGAITGEGVFGLQRGFKMAGAQTLLMSLWPVNDKATQLLMTEFYRGLNNSLSKHDAFQKAQIYLRNYEEVREFEVNDMDSPKIFDKKKMTSSYSKKRINKNIKTYNAPQYWAAFVLLD